MTQHFAHSRQARPEFVQKQHNLANRLHAYMWLLKTYDISAGMYARQSWATLYLQGKEMGSPLQKWLLTVLKRILGVRDTTPSWCVMRHAGVVDWNPTVQSVLRGNAAVQFCD